jgi:dTDP-4-amino-4,6-dideoxygalactose transaminase
VIPVAKPALGAEEAKAAHDAVLSGWVTQGPRVREFEDSFARYVGAAHAVAVSSCTTALHLAFVVAGIGPGDEVLCPSLSYIATANAIVHAGATPVFAEVEPTTLNLDPSDCARRITPRTRAILVVHQLGLPADLDAFGALARDRGLPLIEDAACAAGSAYKGRKIGSHSRLVCFSFHPRKVLTTGDGGMITTSDAALAERLRRLRQHGMSVSDQARHEARSLAFEEHVEIGFNYRMTDIQAAVGIVQLGRLDALVAARREIAARYDAAFAGVAWLRTPARPSGARTNEQSYSLYLRPDAPISRNELMQRLLDRGIASRRGVMTAHREPAYRDRCRGLSLPISEDLSDRSIIIPLWVGMSDAEVAAVIEAVRGP